MCARALVCALVCVCALLRVGLSVCLSVCVCVCDVRRSGLTSEGIYRKSGVNSRVAALCDDFRRDARSICLREGVHQVDDVSNALKRFFRDVEAGLFTPEATAAWLSTVGKTRRCPLVPAGGSEGVRLPPLS